MSSRDPDLTEHVSPDGHLRLRVCTYLDGDIVVGFDGFSWHTHADLLAAAYGLSERDAVSRFVNDVLNGERVLVMWSVDGRLKDVWVSDDPAKDARYADSAYADPGESVMLRYWDGSEWEAEPAD